MIMGSQKVESHHQLDLGLGMLALSFGLSQQGMF
jgi:hypothetical protein